MSTQKNSIYVANCDDNTVSVIDGVANKVSSKVAFRIQPPSAGRIDCDEDNLIVPLQQQFYIKSNTACVAEPYQGFEFVSWQQNLEGNSFQMLQVSLQPSLLGIVSNVLLPDYDKPEGTFIITNFGSFTANFKEIPPPIPAEYVATLFAVIISAFIGLWLIPLIDGRKTRNRGKKVEYYHIKINYLSRDREFNKKHTKILDNFGENITDDFTRGKITKDQY